MLRRVGREGSHESCLLSPRSGAIAAVVRNAGPAACAGEIDLLRVAAHHPGAGVPVQTVCGLPATHGASDEHRPLRGASKDLVPKPAGQGPPGGQAAH